MKNTYKALACLATVSLLAACQNDDNGVEEETSVEAEESAEASDSEENEENEEAIVEDEDLFEAFAGYWIPEGINLESDVPYRVLYISEEYIGDYTFESSESYFERVLEWEVDEEVPVLTTELELLGGGIEPPSSEYTDEYGRMFYSFEFELEEEDQILFISEEDPTSFVRADELLLEERLNETFQYTLTDLKERIIEYEEIYDLRLLIKGAVDHPEEGMTEEQVLNELYSNEYIYYSREYDPDTGEPVEDTGIHYDFTEEEVTWQYFYRGIPEPTGFMFTDLESISFANHWIEIEYRHPHTPDEITQLRLFRVSEDELYQETRAYNNMLGEEESYYEQWATYESPEYILDEIREETTDSVIEFIASKYEYLEFSTKMYTNRGNVGINRYFEEAENGNWGEAYQDFMVQIQQDSGLELLALDYEVHSISEENENTFVVDLSSEHRMYFPNENRTESYTFDYELDVSLTEQSR